MTTFKIIPGAMLSILQNTSRRIRVARTRAHVNTDEASRLHRFLTFPMGWRRSLVQPPHQCGIPKTLIGQLLFDELSIILARVGSLTHIVVLRSQALAFGSCVCLATCYILFLNSFAPSDAACLACSP